MRHIFLGFHCNNACIFCAQGKMRARSGPPSVDEAIEAVQRGETVAFVGGEPTLTERLPDYIRAVGAQGASQIIVQTNGRRLAYRAYARTLSETSSRLVLDIALQGSNEGMHEYHTATPGSFKQTALGIRNAHAEGIPVGVTTVVTRSNYRHLAEILDVARRLGANAHHFAVAEPIGSLLACADALLPTPELIRPYLSQAVTDARKRGIGLLVGDKATPPETANRFAGLGRVEEPMAEEAAGDESAAPAASPVIPDPPQATAGGAA